MQQKSLSSKSDPVDVQTSKAPSPHVKVGELAAVGDGVHHVMRPVSCSAVPPQGLEIRGHPGVEAH